ncbi:response regulator transcription factor [Companilactobacillus keshanensis]|uniref:Response regulator transcription factor n=1 Tax=Companilactobacillus keshanensis TaxID=2486003 RepID=A0ABW4BVL2_9LACO|nr:LytTR family DNA-binding domain-containing protein [Companilactobacillus keshanensis]
MFPVFLLEDNDIQRQHYKTFINNGIMINDAPMELKKAVATTEDLFTDPLPEQGLFFLDMEINSNKMAGLEAATKIRHQVPLAQIVFITTHDELSIVTLERRIAPLDYILKDKGFDDIKERINNDIQSVQLNIEKYTHYSQNLFGYKIGERYFSIIMDDVIMLLTEKSAPGKVTLIAKNQRAEFIGSLNALEEQYTNLFRCDRSYLVNLENINSFDSSKKELSFIDGSTCKVSFRKTKELTEKIKKL